MPNQRARGKEQVSAWVPEVQHAVLKTAAALLGVHLSDIVARIGARYAAAEIEAMKRERNADAPRRVASTKKGNGSGKNRC